MVKMRYRYPYRIAMYSDMSETMGEKNSILVGRTMANLKIPLLERPVSSAERRFWLPVSLRSLLVLRSRIV